MSQMTQKRMTRRATRKIYSLTREARFAKLCVGWREDNIDQLTKALKRALGRETAAAVTPAAQ